MREMGLFPQPLKNKGFLKTILHFILHKTKIQQKNIQRAGNRFRRKCKKVAPVQLLKKDKIKNRYKKSAFYPYVMKESEKC